MGNKLYVGNLSYNVRDDDLQQAFAQYGTVSSAKVMMDRDTGRSKGFGFVEMGSDAEAQAAINGMNGQALDGRAIVVNEARPREERPGGFGGGGSRGGFGGGGGTGGGGFGGGGRSAAAVAATAVVAAATAAAAVAARAVVAAATAAAAVAARVAVAAAAAAATESREPGRDLRPRVKRRCSESAPPLSFPAFRLPIAASCAAGPRGRGRTARSASHAAACATIAICHGMTR